MIQAKGYTSQDQSNFQLKPYFILIGALCAICSLLAWNIYTQLNNNLSSNAQWTSTKIGLEKAVYGSSEYFSGTQALAHNQLNLGAWHGYQEIITKQPVNIAHISMDFKLTPDSYFDFIYNKNQDSYYVFRFSVDKNYPSAIIARKYSGSYLSQTPIKIPELSISDKHHLELYFNLLTQSSTIIIDNNIRYIPNISITDKPIFVGFRGSYNSSFIDNIVIKDFLGSKVFSDDFSYHSPRMILKFAVVLLCFFLVCQFILLLFKRNPKQTFITIISMSNIIFFFLVANYYINYHFISNYPNQDSFISKLTSKLNLSHTVSFPDYAHKLSQEILAKVVDNTRPKVLFLGSSQTWGAGAAKENETFVKIAETIINRSSSIKYQFINAGISGAESTIITEFYLNNWIKLKPVAVFINLSSNDSDPVIFSKNLQQIVSVNKKLNITTFFLLEANSPEATTDKLLSFHSIVRNIAKKENLTVIDIHGFLSAQKNSGDLWWDNVHPTSYGHQLIAEYLINNITSPFRLLTKLQ